MSDISAVGNEPFRPISYGPPTPPKPKPAPFEALDKATGAMPSLDAATIAATKAQAQNAAMTQKVDAYFDAAHATYSITLPNGKSAQVKSPPQFRMNGGFNTAKGLNGALGPSYRKLQDEVGRATAGRGTPEDVRKLTQALIDRGHLGPVDPKDPSAAIQAMQWKYGIGVDCSGYVQRAFFAIRGQTGTASERAALGLKGRAVDENFSGLPTNPKFKSVSIASARAGDVMVLGPPTIDEAGHKVLVRSNTIMTDGELARMGAPKGLFTGPVRKLEVDSSWGAGSSGTGGGVQRRTWLYDETTKKWASFDAETNHIIFSTMSGPYDHPLVGIYRPKGEP
jgi:hypothetical protein